MNASNMTNILNTSSPNTTILLQKKAVYSFAPLSEDIKVAILCVYVVTGLYAVVANSLILYFTFKRRPVRRPYNRQPLVDRYIKSLALSDVLCFIISAPIFTTELFVDFVQTNLMCKAVRVLQMYFPIVTVCNYILIGIEQYIGIFYPFILPSNKLAMRLVVAAWLVAAALDIMPNFSYNLVRFDLSETLFTLTCKYDTKVKLLYRGLFVESGFFIWIIPCFLLTYTNIRICFYLKMRKRAVRQETSPQDPQVQKDEKRQAKTNSLFVQLIFAFIVPYIVFVFYSALTMVIKPDISFAVDYVIRYFNVFLTYANGAIGSTILFRNSNFHRKKLIALFRRFFRRNDNEVINQAR